MLAKYPDVFEVWANIDQERKDASNIVISLMVMTVSIFTVDCHVKRDMGRSILASFRVCTRRGANRCTIGILRTVDSIEVAKLLLLSLLKVVLSINGNGMPCG
jgi:hypothetical protein